MALELDYEDNRIGVTIPSMYAKIARVSFENTDNDEGILVQYTVRFYKNEEAKENEELPFGGEHFTTTLNIGNSKTQHNLLKQCYLHLKEQDGFTGAIDS